MRDAHEVIDAFRQAAELNRTDPVRAGNLLRFPHYGQLVMTGDMHGHMRNFEKLERFCDLARAVVRHVVLHELIHGDPDPQTGLDLSAELLLRAARWKIEHPDQVHFLQSNHELAQLCGQEITKGGRNVSDDFAHGVAHLFGNANGDRVMDAIADFLASYPLAGITTNGVFLSHSLPNARDLSRFRPDIVNRKLTREELMTDGSVHMLVWGREHRPDLLDQLSHVYQVELFIVGHQPQATGYNVIDDRLLILASDHNHGVFTTIDLGKPLTMSMLVDRIRPFVAVP
jgi:hypothetical protein